MGWTQTFKGVALGMLGLALFAVGVARSDSGGESASEADGTLQGTDPTPRRLAELYCGACHIFPEPELLDRKTWKEGALDWMEVFMGRAPERVENSPESELLKETGRFPEQPMIPDAHWKAIRRYYLENAPAEPLPQESRPPIELGLPQFEVLPQQYRKSIPMSTMVSIDSTENRLYVGDANRLLLDRLDAEGNRLGSVKVGNMPVSMTRREGGFFLTSIGKFFPSEVPKGEIVFLAPRGRGYQRHVIREELPRPTHAAFGDLNQNGQDDFVLTMFGNFAGRLSWFERTGPYEYEEHLLMDHPGTVRSEIHDLNGDGLPDIAALVGQEKEAFYIFWNSGNGEFERETVFRHPPTFGHTYFEMVDWNGDGRLDILATNGDNGDYEPAALKRYHGIRIYLNEGDDGFQESYFYPLNGCFKAVARDFDQDGDLDIAAIAYFPNYKQSPRESFVYLENRGAFDFTASTFPECVSGRWLTMDVGDIDGNGSLDIVLGSVIQGPGEVPDFLKETWQKTGLAALILRNNEP